MFQILFLFYCNRNFLLNLLFLSKCVQILIYNFVHLCISRNVLATSYNPVPNQPSGTSLSETLFVKEEMLVTYILSFSHTVFNPLKENSHHLNHIYFIIWNLFQYTSSHGFFFQTATKKTSQWTWNT